MALPKIKRFPASGLLITFVGLLTILATYFYVVETRRATRLSAIKAYMKGEIDCRLLGSKFIDLANKEQVEASKLPNESELRNRHLENFKYYNRMAKNNYQMAESNAKMVYKLKQDIYKP